MFTRADERGTGTARSRRRLPRGLATASLLTVALVLVPLLASSSQATFTAAATSSGNGWTVAPLARWVPGLAWWLDADDGATTFQDTGCTQPAAASGDAVACWLDRSGNERHVIQSSPAAQPTLEPGVLNDRPIVRFSDDAFPADVTARTVFLVLSVASDAPADTTILAGGGADDGIRRAGAETSWRGGSAPGTDATDLASGPGAQVWLNGEEGGHSFHSDVHHLLVHQAGGGARHLVDLGRPSSAPQRAFRGDLAELLVYDRVLTADERTMVEAYLVEKWGLRRTVVEVLASPTAGATWAVPAGVAELDVHAWGAGGGGGGSGSGAAADGGHGGGGGFAAGSFEVVPGEELTVTVGGGGNGGGRTQFLVSAAGHGGGGGGVTSLSRGSTPLVVAPGGGGGGGGATAALVGSGGGAAGGVGGGPTGGAGSLVGVRSGGGGGTEGAGGAAGSGGGATPGSALVGGNGAPAGGPAGGGIAGGGRGGLASTGWFSATSGGGGGGAGWFGGGGAVGQSADGGAGGGGGSGWVDGAAATLVAGTGSAPGNDTDPLRGAGVGLGGAGGDDGSGQAGGDGQLVLRYTLPITLP